MNLQSIADLPPVAKREPNKICALSEASITTHRECRDALGIGYPPRLRDAAARAERFLASVADQAVDLRAAMTPLSVSEIGSKLIEFVGAWPNASNGDLAGYGAQLAGEIIEENPCRYALDEALRKMRRNSKFLPSIAEVLVELETRQSLVRDLALRIQRLPSLIEQLRAEAEKRDRICAEHCARREKALLTHEPHAA